MPTTRNQRTTGGGSHGPAAKGSQSTLRFGTKAGENKARVTKAVVVPKGKDKGKEIGDIVIKEGKVKDDDVVEVTEEIVAKGKEVEVVMEKEAVKVEKERTEYEKAAEKVDDKMIRAYWRDREAERRAGRVHQEDLSVEEKILRLFDMSSQYGPCIGIPRMKRWVRANKLGLNPPIEVLAVLMKEDKRGNAKIERAYVDELMGEKGEVRG